jgi:hypothetical protein
MSETAMVIVFATLLGAVWRIWDGRGAHTHPGILNHSMVRLAVALIGAVFALAVVGRMELIWLWPLAVALVSVNAGPAKFLGNWDDWMMGFRYSVPAAVAVAPFWALNVPGLHWAGFSYIGVCALAGFTYPILKPKVTGLVSEWLPEGAVGAAVLGGLVWM